MSDWYHFIDEDIEFKRFADLTKLSEVSKVQNENSNQTELSPKAESLSSPMRQSGPGLCTSSTFLIE